MACGANASLDSPSPHPPQIPLRPQLLQALILGHHLVVQAGCVGRQLRGQAPEERQITTERSLALTHNLGGYPGEMVSFVSILGRDLG